jgi:hypothetical protein
MTDSEVKTYYNNQHVAKMREKLRQYDTDEENPHRLALQLCKYCQYIMTGRIAGQAITPYNCRECGKNLIAPTTLTDKYCEDCAQKQNLCRQCGATMD